MRKLAKIILAAAIIFDGWLTSTESGNTWVALYPFAAAVIYAFAWERIRDGKLYGNLLIRWMVLVPLLIVSIAFIFAWMPFWEISAVTAWIILKPWRLAFIWPRREPILDLTDPA